jgi:predicted ribosome quality control (RQC) complex YloA/Tae2 family protein
MKGDLKMPLDGIVVNALVEEFNNILIDGKIDKVYQPEKDELVLLVRNNGENYRLLASAASNNPRVHVTQYKGENPQTPPMFCMLLRKHLIGGKIVKVYQPDFERIIIFEVEKYDELGDLTIKKLIAEIMGRHSNIILTNNDDKIIDCIKHVDILVSSVRQVLPGKEYVFPPSQDKLNPLLVDDKKIENLLLNENNGTLINKFFVNNFSGISPLIGREISYRTFNSCDKYIGELTRDDISILIQNYNNIFNNIKNKSFEPLLLKEKYDNIVKDFSAINIMQYTDLDKQIEKDISTVLDTYYNKKDYQEKLKQKSNEVLRIINTNLERCRKKLIIQQDKMTEAEGKDIFKRYGDLITANIYRIKQGMDKVVVEDFFSEALDKVEIPLDKKLSPSKNAQKYFNKYTKAKNAQIAVKEQIAKNLEEIEYLESLLDSLTKIEYFSELKEIRDELYQQGYIKRQKLLKKDKSTKEKSITNPKHFVSSDGFDIYVGKNNKQNDLLTLKLARKSDYWFHTKTIPGSHVIVKVDDNNNVPDNTLLQAANIAAYYSKGKSSSNVAVDYTLVKNVKKPSGAKPGMVIYVNYNTIYTTPDEKIIKSLEKNK